MKKIFLSIVIITVCYSVFAEKKLKLEEVIKLKLKNLNSLNYIHQEGSFYNSYEDMYLGYDKDDNANIGIIVKIIKKTYKKIKVVLIIKKEADNYHIIDILVPNISIIKDEVKKAKVQKSINSFKGVVIRKKKVINKVDAISGATYCHKKVYSDLNEMSEMIIEFMNNKNDLKKTIL